MAPRDDLQTLLESITDNVYFQPPSNTTIEYPCIIYARDLSKTEHADNVPYCQTKRYMVTVIDRDPDTYIADQVEALPMCTFTRFYPANDLNHHVFNLYF